METFKDIIGYEGLYQVSNLGRIKSLPRNTARLKIKKELGFDNSLILKVCKGKRKTTRGYNWTYLLNLK